MNTFQCGRADLRHELRDLIISKVRALDKVPEANIVDSTTVSQRAFSSIVSRTDVRKIRMRRDTGSFSFRENLTVGELLEGLWPASKTIRHKTRPSTGKK